MGEQKTKKINQEEALKEANEQIEKLEKAKRSVSKENKPTEEKTNKKDKKTTKKNKKSKPKLRSKKYQQIVEEFDKIKKYDLTDAISWVKKTSYSKFPGSVEIHINLIRKKNRTPFRAMIELPHGTGKKLNVIVLDEKKVEEIAKTKKVNFDIALATPAMMPKIARIAKILGPKGKMPNPKSGTVTVNPEETIKEFSAGKVEIKEDKDAIIHQIIGKVDWDEKKLSENIEKLFKILPKSQLMSVVISATMGPGVKIKL